MELLNHPRFYKELGTDSSSSEDADEMPTEKPDHQHEESKDPKTEHSKDIPGATIEEKS